jgi:hypothetical protein
MSTTPMIVIVDSVPPRHANSSALQSSSPCCEGATVLRSRPARPHGEVIARLTRSHAPQSMAAKKAPTKRSATAVRKKTTAAKTVTRKRTPANNKTVATDASVAKYFARIASADRRADCEAIAALMSRATGEPAVMWGTAIVGFGSYHYVYESGREGDSCLVGFASRATEIALYLADFPKRDALLAKLGKHKTAKACIYIKSMADVDAKVLQEMVKQSVAARKAAH